MVNTQDTIGILLDVESKELDRTTKKVERLTARLSKLKNPLDSKTFQDLKKVNAQMEVSSKKVQNLQIQTTKMGRAWEISKQGVYGFNGALLSTLFFGMEMQRIFGGAISSIFEGYKKIMPEASSFNILTTRLSANWEFFKFQLADALANSPLFQRLIGFAIGLLQAFQRLPESVKTFIVASMAIAAVIGAFMLYASVIGLGIAGLKDLAAGMKAVGLSITNLPKMPLLAGAAVIAGVALLAKSMNDFHNSSELGAEAGKNMKKNWMDTINSIFSPLMEGLGNTSFEIKNMNEWWLIIGVTVHNMVTIFGALIDMIVAVARIMINFVTMVLRPFANGFKNTMGAIYSLITGDFVGAWDSAKKLVTGIFDGMGTDFMDMVDAMGTGVDNITNKLGNLQGYGPALDAYRAEIEMSTSNAGASGSGGTTVNNTNIMMMTDALANGTITNEQYNAFIEASQFQTGN